MAREYYYLIAGLPDLFIDQDRKDFNLLKLKDEIRENIHPDDFKLVELLFLEYDNYNFQNFLFNRHQEFNHLAKIPLELYADFEEQIDLFPKYMQHFYLHYKGKFIDEEEDETPEFTGNIIEKNPEVLFQEQFFTYITSTNCTFLTKWYSFIRDFNNILTAISCRKFGIEVAPQMVGDGELVETLSRSQASDFGLKKEVDFLEPMLVISEIPDIIERERRFDLLKWNVLDELTTFDYFNINKILAFLVKAGMVQRWVKLDAKVGHEMFQKLVKDLRETYELPKEFAK
jgi:hypothetical protein